MARSSLKSHGSPATSKAERRVAAPPNTRIGFLVHDVSRMRRTVYDQELKPVGVTRAQWWALANLSRHEPKGMTQSELARLLDVGKVTVGGLIDRLEASGYVERRADQDDRRVNRIYITESGYSMIGEIAEIGRRLNDRITAGISADKIRIAEEVMHRMKLNLRDILQINLTASDMDEFEG